MFDFMKNLNNNLVGTFWYDYEQNCLFGLNVYCSDLLQWNLFLYCNLKVKTTRDLHHKEIWEINKNLGIDYRFLQDFYKYPRGRSVLRENDFVVFCGSWINDYPLAKEIIIKTLNLPNDTKFEIDIHWDLGHGKSCALF